MGEPLRRFAAAHEELLRTELTPWPRRVSGYPLDWLLPERGFDVARALVGTEGTCVVVARRHDAPLGRRRPAKCLLVLGFADDIAAAAAVPALLDRAAVHGREPHRGAAGARGASAVR